MINNLDFLNVYQEEKNLKAYLQNQFDNDRKYQVLPLKLLCTFSLHDRANATDKTLKFIQKIVLDTLREYVKIFKVNYEKSEIKNRDLYTPYIENIALKYIEFNDIDSAISLINELIMDKKSPIIICFLIHKIIQNFIFNNKINEAKKLLKLSKDLLLTTSVPSQPYLKQVLMLKELNEVLKIFNENEDKIINQRITYLFRVTNPAFQFF
jgi:hypothetical protein